MNFQKVGEYFTEVLGWIQIAASPFLAGLVIATIYYVYNPDENGILVGGIITFVGLLTGIIWATKVWKTKGTMWFLSRIMASRDFDKLNQNQKTK
ncbi:MAG: hypothetical protein EOO01_42500 [Chitinophagaceae bacterium]|nr:MAG: hypothetical protein EOO01_42500 [Chitinophagaceae bacterium]